MKQQKKNWPAESNMTALKTLSHTLLRLDIQPTKMSPLVVKHPFTDSGLAGIHAEDGSLSVGNLLDSPNALRTWRENFSQRINDAETAMDLFWMITKPYQFGYLRLAAAHLSEQDMASLLSYACIRTIALELGLSRSTVKRALDELCRAGLLQKAPRWRENGSLTSNLYRVT